MDGRPVEEWLEAASVFIAQGSPQYRRYRGARFLANVQLLREELGLARQDAVDVGLTREDGQDRATVSVELLGQALERDRWPMRGSQLLPGNIGYLRVPRMRTWRADLVNEWMGYFRPTDGLIVDVRSNGGGIRHVLNALFPYLMKPDDAPRVCNVGVYRLFDGYEPHHMVGRFMYRAASPHWTPEEREVIAALGQRWEPEWTPPQGEFSQWHYMVLSRRLNTNAYFYDRPVVLLMDYACFSATDIFLSGFEGWRNVTLVGTPSGGGSAYSKFFELPNSHLRIRNGSMVSFKRDGRLHDGTGIQPDVRLEATAESFLRRGPDNQLQKALELLRTE
jgi:C-terminal processing protease CtpA/Prc